MTEVKPSRAGAWLRILRVPNLLTVPGDPVAGYLLVAKATTPWPSGLLFLVLSSLCLYAGGLLLNDLADLDVDRAERPGRPLPCGAIDVSVARQVALLLMLIGLLCAARVGFRSVTVAAVLAAAVFAYNLWTKSRVLLGPVNMGLCRSLSLVLGATGVGYATSTLLIASIGLTMYVASVSYLARKETTRGPTGWARWIPPLVILGVLIATLRVTGSARATMMTTAMTFLFTMTVAVAAAARSVRREGLPPAIGLFLSALLGWQAAFCLAADAGARGAIAAGLLLLLWPVHRVLARQFAPS